MMLATSSTYVQHALWNYPSRAFREQKTKQLTARGPESTVCTARRAKAPSRRTGLGGRPRLATTLHARGTAVCRATPKLCMTRQTAELAETYVT